MSQVLSGAESSTVTVPSSSTASSFDTTNFETTSNQNDVKPFFTPEPSNSLTCPTHCMCTCPQLGEINTNSNFMDELKKVDLDITLLPCARTAAYQLDLALKLCRRKKKELTANK